ncbi:MAG: thiamine-phosphate kinase [Gammaproteobacteria bacterium]|jgi:thiamine-monophosphate kinase
MPGSEFDIIRRYFTRQRPARPDVILGIGDDAAVLQVPAGMELVVCIDTLVSGVHFSGATMPDAIGHKALAVNLSDLAAMGADPAWASLSLTLPADDPPWLERFAQGFFALADRYGVQLVGGDITRGPLAVTVQAHGFVPGGRALRRQGARAGDSIYVTGTLGDAGFALQQPDALDPAVRQRLDYPRPRIQAGQRLRDYASAAIDISDGLLADLGHLLEADDLGADLQVDALPRSAAFRAALADSDPRYDALPLGAGDDYELCFTVPGDCCSAMEAALAGVDGGCKRIGVIAAAAGIRCHRVDGSEYHPTVTGYQHFGPSSGNA